MSWTEYYRLFEKYDGLISKATKEELAIAARGNPNDPFAAEHLAWQEWQKKKKRDDLDRLHAGIKERT